MPHLQSKPCTEAGHPADQPKTLTVEVTHQQHEDYVSGRKLIQHIFPDMSTDDRERFISGTCAPCWTALFAYLDEEDDD